MCTFYIFLVLWSYTKAQEAVDTLITINTIKKAEKISGLNFNEAERDSMQDGLNRYLENYQNIREFSLENNIPPAFIFNPIPLNFHLSEFPKKFKISDYSYTQIPERIEELSFYPVGELAELIRTRKLSSLELTQFCLNRLKNYGPVLECVITLTEDLALKQAKQADIEIAAGKYRGPLHGIPYGIKDLFSKKGYKTTWGATPYKDQIIDQDATVVKKLEEAGAVSRTAQ